jgi:metabolite-proton symporter
VSEGPKAALGSARELRRVIFASLIGTTIEWYDFFLYGTAAALVFNRLFFPTGDPLTGTLIAYGTNAVAFLARPIGGALFGHFGDRYGRKRLLMVSLITMALATTAIGCLPTYAQIGRAAPVLLIALRVLQGFAVGGEWGGAVLLIGEHCASSRRAFFTSWAQFGVPAGNLLATVVLAIMSTWQSQSDFMNWGWRVPFLLSAILLVLGWWLRSNLTETAAFKTAQQRRTLNTQTSPIRQALKEQPLGILIGTGLRMGENISYYIITIFSLTYLESKHPGSRSLALNALSIGAAAECATLPLWAALADRIGRRPVYAIGALGMAIWMVAMFGLLNDGTMGAVIAALVIGLFFHGAMYGPQAAFISELFPTHVRYSGVSLAYQVSAIIAGSWAPFIALNLYQKYHDFRPVAGYVILACLISAVTAFLAKETRNVSLSEMA